jgi:hypothetical protein
MPIQFTCSCGRKLQGQDEHAGRRVKCPGCGVELTVPGADGAVQTTEPARPRPSAVQEGRRRREDDETDEERPRRSSRRYDDDDEEDDDRPAAPRGMSGKAIAALVLAFLAFCLNLFAAAPAIVFAVMSLGEVNRGRGRLSGKGMAIAALVVAIIGTLFSGFAYYYAVARSLSESVGAVRESAGRLQSGNNIKQMTLGIISDSSAHKDFLVAPASYDKDGKPLLSWRVAILPWVDQQNLYAQFRLDEPWDGPNNIRLVTQMPKIYAHPSDPNGAARGLTCYRVFTGPHTAFPDPVPPFPRDHSTCHYPASFLDGTSNSILIVEAADTVPWTKPDELPYDPNKPLPKLGGWSRQGYNVGLADGSVKFITPGVSEQTLRNAITIDDGMALGRDW